MPAPMMRTGSGSDEGAVRRGRPVEETRGFEPGLGELSIARMREMMWPGEDIVKKLCVQASSVGNSYPLWHKQLN